MNNFMKSLLLHVKYPYTALIIAVMWIGVAIIINMQAAAELEVLIGATVFASLVVAIIGFASPK